MSLERQDVRSKLDPDMKRALQAICDARGVTESDFIEALLVPEIERLVHEATVITERLRGQGASGRNREKSGIAGTVRE